MNINPGNHENSHGLHDAELQIVAAQKTGDRQERMLTAFTLLEEITGKGMNSDLSEYVRQVNRMKEKNAIVAVDAVIEELKNLRSETDESKNDIIMLDAYLRIAQEALDELVHHETKEADSSDDVYEIDFGNSLTQVPLTGHGFERAYLYPQRHFLATLTEAQQERMRDEMRSDKRLRRVKDEEIIDDAMKNNPYEAEPWNPKTKWLSNVLYDIHEEFGLFEKNVDYDNMQKNLIIVPCVNEKADILRGCDCMVVYIDPVTKERTIVTIDLSTNEEDKLIKGFKADLLVSPYGAHVHGDIRLQELKNLYAPAIDRKICAHKARERRKQIGQAAARILKFKIQEKQKSRGLQEIHHFRLPGEKNVLQNTRQNTYARLIDTLKASAN